MEKITIVINVIPKKETDSPFKGLKTFDTGNRRLELTDLYNYGYSVDELSEIYLMTTRGISSSIGIESTSSIGTISIAIIISIALVFFFRAL